MERRGFLKSMLALGVAPAVITSGVLMPVRAIALPTDAEVLAVAGGGNTLLTPELITREALRILNENISFMSTVNRQFDEAFSPSGTIKIRRPLRYGSV